ncbi:hypothetical protein FB567DRAFT_310390 [Paraphoma chrysanthemicola]|uniref:SprT-like domain-containing protein n=1 Tax=Paraphoma chrysanthemicola TaxID=798071 RepID=A0A8K0R9T2_9PLEO|nr:hypothetical protein FB567DRAFT_310390 [Paraphoma chrysanthemicola]
MGQHEDAVISSTPRRRRIHPLRRITRVVFRGCYRRREEGGASTEICRGPSFFHNLLPIVEPFLLLDPKLLFIEDHILGRPQAPRNGKSYKIPANVEELRVWIKEASTPCDCDECAPWLYQLCEDSAHGVIRDHPYALTRKRDRFVPRQDGPALPRPELSLRLYGEYETMRLVRYHITWLDDMYINVSPEKCGPNVRQLQSLLHAWKPNLTGPDMRTSMSSTQALHLISVLNQVFFFGSIPPHRQAISAGFSWLSPTDKSCFGIGTFNSLIGTQVLLHPTLYRTGGNADDLDVRWRNRLGTILHELCHAFLKAYTCRSCPMHDHCVGARGHGRAWQLLAAKMEEVATGLMGGFVDFGRWPSLLNEMEGCGKLPSAHDLETLQVGTKWEK